jgi:two-component system, OmpR family, osmolarity sensor histidine kinase EnvZ
VLGRFGFVGRLSAILMLALIALWALGAGISSVTRSPIVALPGALPLPHQMAAIVELLETSDPARRATILNATSSDILRVTLSDKAPTMSPEIRRLNGIEWLIGRYVGALGARDVIATIAPSDVARLQDAYVDNYWQYIRQPLRVAVGLKSGGYVVFETYGEISRRLFGLPPGFWVGVLGSLVGIAALVAVWREARPLHELSRSVSRFSGDGRPAILAPRGAPELRRLIVEVNRMQERIATLLKGRAVLLGAISHDLKTYITRLKLRAEMIADQDQQARAERDLDDMTNLIEQTLALARGTAVAERMSTVDLAEVIRSTCDDRSNIAFRAPTERVDVEGDATALRRLFANVIDNALRYGKSCTVSVARVGDFVRTTIDDDGPGIPADERSLVFEPFYRLENSRNRSTGGSGLGLAIAKQIVDAHGGSISIGSAPAAGARLIIELPNAPGASFRQ